VSTRSGLAYETKLRAGAAGIEFFLLSRLSLALLALNDLQSWHLQPALYLFRVPCSIALTVPSCIDLSRWQTVQSTWHFDSSLSSLSLDQDHIAFPAPFFRAGSLVVGSI
jgi:hypothetical protein